MKALRAILIAALVPMALGLVIVTYQDAVLTHLPARAVIAEELRAFRVPFIHPGASCGQPLLGNPNFGVFFPDTLLAVLLPLDVAFGLRFVLVLVLGFVGARRLGRAEGASREGAEIAAWSFVLSGIFLSTWRFFNSGLALALAPFVIAAAAKLARREGEDDNAPARRRAVAEMALFVGLEILAGEPVIALLAFSLATARTLVPLLADRARRRRASAATGRLAAAFLLGALIAAPQIAATAQILGDSSRERKPIPFPTATGTSVPPVRLLEQLVPFPYGRPDLLGPEGFAGHRLFDNHAPYLWTLHAGLLVLAVLALHGRVRSGEAAVFAGASVLAMVLSQGRYLAGARALYPLLSLGGRIRFPVKWWFVVAVALVPLVARAASRWSAAEPPTRAGRVLHAMLTAAAVAALVGAFPRTPLAAAGSLLALALAASLPWWPRRPTLLATAVVVSLGLSSLPLLLAYLDVPPPAPRALGSGRVYSRVEAEAHPSPRPETTTPVREFFRRAAPELWPLTATRAGVGYAFDFDPDGAYADEDRAIRRTMEPWPWADRATELRLAGVTTVVTDRTLESPYQPLTVLDAARGVAAYTLEGAAPAVRLATRVRRAPDLATVMAEHRDPGFDVLRDVVLDGPYARPIESATREGRATALTDLPARLVAEVTSDGAGVLVWSRTYFGAWRAAIDGLAAPVVRADGHLVGVEVPAGTHRVTVEWDARPVYAGLGLSLAGLALTLALRRR